ncbi:hypothetical protein C8R44DRAFT_886605 [Mycena epipterygia]|nr:hypothetical protein C8R44DRAFT_886605 [Mycena epipterygia]
MPQLLHLRQPSMDAVLMSQNTAGTTSRRRGGLELDAAQLCGETIHRPPPRTRTWASAVKPSPCTRAQKAGESHAGGSCSAGRMISSPITIAHFRRLSYLMATVRSTTPPPFPDSIDMGSCSFPATSLFVSSTGEAPLSTPLSHKTTPPSSSCH